MTLLLPRVWNCSRVVAVQASFPLFNPKVLQGSQTRPIAFFNAHLTAKDLAHPIASSRSIASIVEVASPVQHYAVQSNDLFHQARQTFSTWSLTNQHSVLASRQRDRSPSTFKARQTKRLDHAPATHDNHRSIHVRRANITIALIVLLNIFIYIHWYTAGRKKDIGKTDKLEWMYLNFAASWFALHLGHYSGLLFSCVSHNDAVHIFLNMSAFALTAVGLTSKLTGGRIVQLYCAAGILSTLTTMLWERFYLRPKPLNDEGVPVPKFHLGASGSIFAFFSFSAATYPMQRFLLFFVVPIQSRLLIPAIALFETLCLLDERGIGKTWHENVAKPLLGDVELDSAAHLGGIAVGYIYAFLLRRRV